MKGESERRLPPMQVYLRALLIKLKKDADLRGVFRTSSNIKRERSAEVVNT